MSMQKSIPQKGVSLKKQKKNKPTLLAQLKTSLCYLL